MSTRSVDDLVQAMGMSGSVDVATWPSLVDYLVRMQARPQVKAAIDHEIELRKTVKV